MAKPLFITGTDTDVGKTVVATGLLCCFAEKGKSTCAIKPVAAGCESGKQGLCNDDALALQAAATTSLPYTQVNPIALKEACAPHIAAFKEGRRIQLPRIEGICRGVLTQKADICVIEGAGGWRVPLNERESLSGLAVALNSPVILVVGMKLGCLNHALLTAEAIVRDGLPIAGWVANTLDQPMSYLDENIATLEGMLPAPCLGVVPSLRSDIESKGTLDATGKSASQYLNISSLLG